MCTFQRPDETCNVSCTARGMNTFSLRPIMCLYRGDPPTVTFPIRAGTQIKCGNPALTPGNGSHPEYLDGDGRTWVATIFRMLK